MSIDAFRVTVIALAAAVVISVSPLAAEPGANRLQRAIGETSIRISSGALWQSVRHRLVFGDQGRRRDRRRAVLVRQG